MKPKFIFTGQEISDKLYDLIQRLENGEEITPEEFEETEEFVVANGMTRGGTETVLLKGREKIQQKVFDDISKRGSVVFKDGKKFFEGPVLSEKRLDVVIGLPASGKSSSVAEKISEETGALLLDNDEIKKILPGYYDGWGDAMVHQESKKINKRLIQHAIKEGKNIVLPKIGGYAGEIKMIMTMAKKAGYTVNLHYVDLERNKAVLRLLYRFINEGRFIPPSTVYQDNNEIDGNKIKKVFDELIASGLVDGYSIWNNDVPRGERPILLEAVNLTDKFITSANTIGTPNVTTKTIPQIQLAANNIEMPSAINVFEQSFFAKYGKEKFAFFKQLERIAKLNKDIDLKQFNPEYSLLKLKLLLEIQILGLKVKNPDLLSEAKMLEIIDKTTKSQQPLSAEIYKYKLEQEQNKKTSNSLVQNISNEVIK